MTKLTNKTTRRSFMTGVASIASASAALAASSAKQPLSEIVDKQPFGRLEKIGENVWAIVSTPFNKDGSFNMKSYPTLCNGGIIAGKDKVVAIDGFMTPTGSAWLASKAEELLGRKVTDVIVTHFHADHTGGLAGYQNGAEGPEIIATDMTRRLIFERYSGPTPIEGSPFFAPAIRPVLPTRIIANETKTLTMDLGGRTVTLDHKSGHTPSDLAIHVDDTPITFAGDLIWAGIFHNYVDAIPSDLRSSAAALLKDGDRTIVPGHGYVAKAKDLTPYLDLLDIVEEKARASFQRGQLAAEGAATFKLPESLGVWRLFAPNYYEVAFNAWYRELGAK